MSRFQPWLVICLLMAGVGCKKKAQPPVLLSKPSGVSKVTPVPSEKKKPPLPQQSPQPPSNDWVAQGLWWLYQLRYQKARESFGNYIQHNPHDPAGYFYRAATDWWELAQNFDQDLPSIRRNFAKDYQKTLALTKPLLKSQDAQVRAKAYFYLGGIEGLQGRLLITQKDWAKAYFAGQRGYKALLHALEDDPHLEDAYLGLGVYDYYTATLKGVRGALSSILTSGNRERGLDEIQRVIQKGTYATIEGKVFLIEIYLGHEKKPDKALRIARELQKQFPQSPAMQLAVITTLQANHRWPEMEKEAHDFLNRSEKKVAYYTADDIPAGHYFLGLSRLKLGNAEQGLVLMNSILKETANENSRWATFAYLGRGQAYDLLGKREDAKKEYRHVLSRKDVWDSHTEAKRYLKKPYVQNPQKENNSSSF